MQSAPPRPIEPAIRRDVPLRERARYEEPRRPASAAALGLTLVGCWIIAATAQRVHEDRGGGTARPAPAPEHIVYVAPDEPAATLVPPFSAPTSTPTTAPRSTSRADASPAVGVPASSSASRLGFPAADSVAGASPRADAATRPAAARPPAPGVVFRGPVGAPLCLPPCGARPSVGLGREAPPLTMAEMDSVLQGVRGVVRTAPKPRPRAAVATGPSELGEPPPMLPGVSAQVPLPGGGPSAEQRRRDSVANAAALARLARIRARTDSLTRQRLDSLERAGPRRP